MSCITPTQPGVICGHSIMRHEGDESGMGAPEPCMEDGCLCENYTMPPRTNGGNS